MRMPSVLRRQAVAYLVVILALLALVGRSVLDGGSAGDSARSEADGTLAVLETSVEEIDDPEPLLVHVAGAVRDPGVYELEAGSRVADAVHRAG